MNVIKKAFTEILGTESVFDPTSNLGPNLVDETNPNYSKIPSKIASKITCIIYPNSQTELSQTIALAHKNKWQILTSNLNWGAFAKFDDFGIIVNTSRLNRLIDHAVGDLTVTCEAGMKFRDLQNILAKSGQFLAIDPAHQETITIGEIVNTANTGSLRQRYGGVRDLLLGISFVRADGELVKAGGRVVKNVAGYDLMKLMTGAYGSLGVIAQVTFRLYPLPQCDRTVIVTGSAQAIDLLRAKILISNLTPWAIDILSTKILNKLELSSINTEIGLILRFGGLTQGVEEQIRRLSVLTKDLGLEIQAIESNTSDKIQSLIWQNFSVDSSTICPIVCKIGTLSDIAVRNLLKISSEMKGSLVQIYAGSGLGVLRYESSDLTEIRSVILKIRNLLETTGGFLTILEASSHIKDSIDIWGYSGNTREIIIALKHKFDPYNLLNPHGYIG
jgi:glycolate oxidase FAD binding subunit